MHTKISTAVYVFCTVHSDVLANSISYVEWPFSSLFVCFLVCMCVCVLRTVNPFFSHLEQYFPSNSLHNSQEDPYR